MANDPSPQRWEIWHARFDFDGAKGYKFRPVIVLERDEDSLFVMMVTSTTNKLSLPHDYAIRDWQAAGLEKPSIARADRIAELPPGYLGTAGRIGQLSQADQSALEAILHSMIA